ncbi:MAG: c-type cytochrome domain-containing protein [Polyangia bacterium]
MPRRVPSRALALAVLATALGTAGCPPPPADDPDAAPQGPSPTSVVPEPGSTGVPVDAVIRVKFNDHLDGRSISQARFDLHSGSVDLWVMASYDPVRGELRVWPSARMRKKALWLLELKQGLAGLDGELVPPGKVTQFETGEQATEEDPYPLRNWKTHVAPIFESRCVSCHGGASPLAELRLDSREGISQTLLGAESGGWDGWRRAIPARPGQSYLLYKLIGDPRIAGEPMPRSMDREEAALLAESDRRVVSDWISSGAPFFDPEQRDN